MAIPNTAGLQRKPTHPGEMLREDFLPDYGLTVSGLAKIRVNPRPIEGGGTSGQRDSAAGVLQ